MPTIYMMAKDTRYSCRENDKAPVHFFHEGAKKKAREWERKAPLKQQRNGQSVSKVLAGSAKFKQSRGGASNTSPTATNHATFDLCLAAKRVKMCEQRRHDQG